MALGQVLNAQQAMDDIYRRQRHIYDATRKFYLLGRDRLLAELDVPAGGKVLEVACGTGRNLIAAARRYPEAKFYGFDISRQMLRTAQASVARAGLGARIHLSEADAAAFSGQALFGVTGFDRVVVSYALSMIPPWREALAASAAALSAGGELHVVDFGQQERLPRWFHAALVAWLSRFSVSPRAEFDAELRRVAADVGGEARVASLWGDYARYGVLRVTAAGREPETT